MLEYGVWVWRCGDIPFEVQMGQGTFLSKNEVIPFFQGWVATLISAQNCLWLKRLMLYQMLGMSTSAVKEGRIKWAYVIKRGDLLHVENGGGSWVWLDLGGARTKQARRKPTRLYPYSSFSNVAHFLCFLNRHCRWASSTFLDSLWCYALGLACQFSLLLESTSCTGWWSHESKRNPSWDTGFIQVRYVLLVLNHSCSEWITPQNCLG